LVEDRGGFLVQQSCWLRIKNAKCGLDPVIDEKPWQRAGPRLPTLKQGRPKSNLYLISVDVVAGVG
jgi:hypothetical protein